jgi:hypothetical protein
MLIKAAKIGWIFLTLVVLGITLYGFDGKPNSDISIVLLWSMLLLAFPISILVALLLAGISIFIELLVGRVVPTSYWWIITCWLCFFAAGYWQWFVMAPWSWRKLAARKASRTAPSLN